jgi:2'-5' RNA ligase
MKVAFWLTPEQSDQTFYQELIELLAQTYDAPTFVPHVTLYWGEYPDQTDFTRLIKSVTQGISSFHLQIDRVDYSDQLTKSVFVKFHPNSTVTKLCESLRQCSTHDSGFRLDPHLSLIYKPLREAQKQSLVSRIELSASSVRFESVMVVMTPNQIETLEDITASTLLYSHLLSKSSKQSSGAP